MLGTRVCYFVGAPRALTLMALRTGTSCHVLRRCCVLCRRRGCGDPALTGSFATTVPVAFAHFASVSRFSNSCNASNVFTVVRVTVTCDQRIGLCQKPKCWPAFFSTCVTHARRLLGAAHTLNRPQATAHVTSPRPGKPQRSRDSLSCALCVPGWSGTGPYC